MTDYDVSGIADLDLKDWDDGETITEAALDGISTDTEAAVNALIDALQAVMSNRSGSSAPTNNTVRGGLWADTSTANEVSLKGDPDGSGADITIARIGTNGLLENTSQWPSFEVTLSGNQAISSADPTKIEWDTETFDTNSDFDSTTNYRFTPTVAGKYLFEVNATISSVADEIVTLILYKNGSGIRVQRFTTPDVGAPASKSASAGWIVDANGSSD